MLAAREDWPERVVGGPHHMGTTRKADDPRHGVVDADCRVHSSENLYVLGCSVFPTGGYANPTLMIVALALRLAEHLRSSLTEPGGYSPASASRKVSSSASSIE